MPLQRHPGAEIPALTVRATRAAETVRCRIDITHTLGLELEDPGFHHSALSDCCDRLLGLALTRIRRAGQLKGRTARTSQPFP
ncbi:hypothetical protein ACWQ06_12535 [Streptomyces angustmyceticus]